MTSSVHHIVADLAARLDYIEATINEDYETYMSSVAEGNGSSMGSGMGSGTAGGGASEVVSSGGGALVPITGKKDGGGGAARLNLSQRLAAVNSTFSKSLIYATASEIGDRLSYFSSVLLPSYISSDVTFEPDRLVDAEATAQRYAVIKRRLHVDGQREFEQLKLNISALCDSAFAKDETGAVIADILSYNGPSTAPATGAEVPVGRHNAAAAMGGAAEGDIRDWVNRAANNNTRAQELQLRLAKAKARYESLVNYSNKQMCVWDLQIEELEKRARRQASQKR